MSELAGIRATSDLENYKIFPDISFSLCVDDSYGWRHNFSGCLYICTAHSCERVVSEIPQRML